MHLSTSLALAAVGLAASSLPAAAGTLLVPSKAYSTIQSALNAAKPYDTVLVSPKVNGKPYSEAVTITTPHVVLQGQNNPVIDGSKLGTTVDNGDYTYTTFPNGIEIGADHVSVRGLTIQGFGFGDGPNSLASGINVGTNLASYSDIEVSGNTLQRNSSGLTIQGYDAQGDYLNGYRVLGNLFSGNTASGASLYGATILVSGNLFTGTKSVGFRGDGLEVTGNGVTVSGNESSGNDGYGMSINATGTYNPAVDDPRNPNPAPTVTALNYIHDNADFGVELEGTQTFSGNVVSHNVSRGINLDYADFSTISGNVVSGTAPDQYNPSSGIGIYAESTIQFFGGGDSGLKISLNQISGNSGDGIYFGSVAGGVVSLNNVTANRGIGIHLSDYTYNSGYPGDAPTTVTQNVALHNTLFDASDDASAPDGDNAKTVNIWTKNLFGKTDPKGLSK